MNAPYFKGPVEILIVEDSPTQAEQLKFILQKHEYTVTTARSGKEALASLAQRRPTMIISDVIMPEMNGYELCRAIRTNDELKNIPLILLTSLSNADDVIKGLECGADNFITKPYNEDYLVTRIQYIFANWHLRELDKTRMGLEVYFAGKKHFITSDRLQILNLLLSTYETAVQKNEQLDRAQEELRKLNQQLEQTNKELEAFSYSVSHDLRAPLRSIEGFSQILVEDFSNKLGEEGLRYFHNILDSTKRMSQLIEDLLKLFGITAGKMNEQSVNLSSMVQSILEDLQRSQPDRTVAINVAPNIVVRGDESLLRVVLENLLGNAWKFTGKKADARIDFGVQRNGTKKVYFVQDNGAGFDMAFAGKLFGPFQRLHQSSEFPGTGIGLATVKRIIHRHGGQVWAESVKDQGTTFCFTL